MARDGKKQGKAVTGRKTRTRRTGTSLTETAVDTIRSRILDLTLAPGSRIDEKLLMRSFGLSRTPAREALNRLTAEGLVVIQANRGAYVRALDIVQLSQFFDAYQIAERMICHFCNFGDADLVGDLEKIQREHGIACRKGSFADIARLNAVFHQRIAASSGNEYVQEFSGRLHNHARRLTYLIYTLESPDRPFFEDQQKRIVSEHEQIIAAIRNADRELMMTMLTRHARRQQDRIMRILASSRGTSFPLP